MDYRFSVFAHFRQADGIQVTMIVVVPLDRRNLLNMPIFKQWIRVLVYVFKNQKWGYDNGTLGIGIWTYTYRQSCDNQIF